jgi:hypothetical protein
VMATNSKSRDSKHRVSKPPRKAQSNQSRTRYSLRSKDSVAAGKPEDVDDEPKYVAIMKYVPDDIPTIERKIREWKEFNKNPPQMMYLDGRDHGNPAMVEKYGDKLPMRWGDMYWPPWELWMDKIGMFSTFRMHDQTNHRRSSILLQHQDKGGQI